MSDKADDLLRRWAAIFTKDEHPEVVLARMKLCDCESCQLAREMYEYGKTVPPPKGKTHG